MRNGSRTISRVFAVALAAAASAVALPAGVALANEDMSNYDGTACQTNQLYDATAGICNTDTVANNPEAPPMDLAGLAADLVSLSDPGARCSSTQYFSVTNSMCWAQTITNDPKAPVVLEGENPSAPPQMGPPTEPKPAAP